MARVAPIQTRKLAVKYGTGTTNTSVVGTSADFPAVREFRTIVGRFFDADEVQGAQRVAVVGQTVLTNLRVGRILLGETLRINNVPFEVIGLLEPKGVNYAGIDEDDQILIPISRVVLEKEQQPDVVFESFFTRILAHELMHSIVSQRQGIPVHVRVATRAGETLYQD